MGEDKNKAKAFPMTGWDDGMFLRQYYAAAALTGILANPNNDLQSLGKDVNNAFLAADFMIKEG